MNRLSAGEGHRTFKRRATAGRLRFASLRRPRWGLRPQNGWKPLDFTPATARDLHSQLACTAADEQRHRRPTPAGAQGGGAP